MNLTEYLEAARARACLPSDNRLADALGIAHPSLLAWKRGHSIPTPERMVRLAELAGIPAELALIDRATWQADGEASRAVMSRIRSAITSTAAASCLFFLPIIAGAASIPADNFGRPGYIMERRRLWEIFASRRLNPPSIAPAT